MFIPNLVGTPIIHQANATTGTTWVPLSTAYNNAAWYANVINGTPQADFGTNQIFRQTGDFLINTKQGIAQQFTITPPLNGDTVGLELNAQIFINGPARLRAAGYVGRQSSAPTLMEAATYYDLPTWLKTQQTENEDTETDAMKFYSYQEQVIINGSKDYLGGTWGHGFQLFNLGAQFTSKVLWASMSIRQLNDQQNIGYRNTRK